MENIETSGVFDLDTMEYDEFPYLPSNIIFDDTLFWFESLRDENGKYTSNIYSKEYMELDEPKKHLLELDSRITYIVLEENNIFIGAQDEDTSAIIYRYSLQENTLHILSKGRGVICQGKSMYPAVYLIKKYMYRGLQAMTANMI